jgi:DNA-binding LacI/PurR family transcriptional regulator
MAQHDIHVPGQVSLVCTDYDGTLTWCQTTLAHMQWDNAPIIRRIVRWVAALRKGQADHKIINYPAEFIDGGSVGPVAKG